MHTWCCYNNGNGHCRTISLPYMDLVPLHHRTYIENVVTVPVKITVCFGDVIGEVKHLILKYVMSLFDSVLKHPLMVLFLSLVFLLALVACWRESSLPVSFQARYVLHLYALWFCTAASIIYCEVLCSCTVWCVRTEQRAVRQQAQPYTGTQHPFPLDTTRTDNCPSCSYQRYLHAISKFPYQVSII